MEFFSVIRILFFHEIVSHFYGHKKMNLKDTVMTTTVNICSGKEFMESE